MTDAFKICPLCEHPWATLREFLDDADLEPVGYQVDFMDLSRGLFLFNHRSCRTTLAAPAHCFRELYRGPVLQGRRTGEDDCPGYCLRSSVLLPCPAECECAWVRALLGIIRDWPKKRTADRPAPTACGDNLRPEGCS
ncbi:MAG TPA: hypothetical protein VLH81_03810 [Desulfobacterales bacterium]|nr:hypothetical protein [Desulfobacterales bacterium]